MIKYELSTEVVELSPGQQSQVTLKIINLSEIIDQFTVYLQPANTPESAGLDPMWVSLSQSQFPLRPTLPGRDAVEGENQQTLTLDLAVPPYATAGSYAGDIIIQAGSGPDNSAYTSLRLLVAKVDREIFNLEPTERVSRAGTEVYQVYLSNQGNSPGLYSVYAEDKEDNCRYEVSPSEVMLDQGQEAYLTLKVKPRHRNWASADHKLDFTVKLEGYKSDISGSFTQRCALPPFYWIRRHVTLFVVLGMLLLGLFIAALIFLFPLFAPIEAAACAPTSTRLVNVVSNNQSTSIFVSGRAGNEPMTRLTTESADRLPALFGSLVSVSPDGRRLAYITARNEALDDANIWIIEIDTRQKRLYASVPTGLWPVAPVWSSDAELIAFVTRNQSAAASPSNATTTASGTITGSPTPPPAGTTTQAASLNPMQLQLWASSINNKVEKPLATHELFTADLFYGDTSPVVCWSSRNNSLIIRPKQTSDLTTLTSKWSTDQQLEFSFPAGTPVSRTRPPLKINKTLPGLTVPAPQIPKLGQSGLAMPLDFSNGQVTPVRDQQRDDPPRQFNSSGSAQTAASDGCPVLRPYSQNDPRWTSLPLRIGGSGKLGDSGCAITAAAILLNQYGLADSTPDNLITCLGDLTAPFTSSSWVAVGQRCSGNRVSAGRNDFSWTDLDFALQKGPAVVGLLGGQTGVHFLVVTSGADGIAESYRVTDPWDGSTYKTLATFLNYGYQIRWLVNFNGGQSIPCGGQASGTTNDLSLELSGPDDGGLYQEQQTLKYEVIGIPEVLTPTVRFNAPKAVPGEVSLRQIPENQIVPFEEEGVYQVDIVAIGKAQTAGEKPPQVRRNLIFTIDRTPPQVSHTIPAPDPKTNNYTGPVVIQLRASDDLSGIAVIEYRINGGNWSKYNSDTTASVLRVSNNGKNIVNYRAIDGAGNVSSENLIEFTIASGSATVAPPIGNTTPAAGPGGSGTPSPGGNRVTTTPPRTATTTAAIQTSTTRVTTPAPTITTPAPTQTTPPPTTITTVVPTTTVPPTTTAAPKPIMAVDLSQLTFGPGVLTQTIKINNNGLGTLNWNILPGASAASLRFVPSNGTVQTGFEQTVSVTLLSSELPLTQQTTGFQVSSDGGNKDVSVTINPQILPTAILNIPNTSGVLTDTVRITLSINVPALSKQPDHAVLIGTYKTCLASSCSPGDITLEGLLKPDTNGNWVFNWTTTNIVPQDSISISGKLCTSTDNSICSDIAPVTGLIIPMDAQITSPATNEIITAPSMNVPVVINATGRAQYVSLSAVYQDALDQPIQIPVQPNASNNWTISWNVAGLTPGRTFNLLGKVCTINNECKDIPSVTNLQTQMAANFVFSQNLDTNKQLPVSLAITLSNQTANINHVSLYATYKTNLTDPTSTRHFIDTNIINLSGGVTTTIWNTPRFPAQSNVILEMVACFSINETVCTPLKNTGGVQATFNNLVIPTGSPASILVVDGSPQRAFLNDTFTKPMQVSVKDAFGNPITNTLVTFAAPAQPNPLPPPQIASGVFIIGNIFGTEITSPSVSVATNANGIATTAFPFRANSISGAYKVLASVSGLPTQAEFQLSNNQIGSIPIDIVSGNDQLARVKTDFAINFQVTVKDINNNPVVGQQLVFTAPGSGASGTFAPSGALTATATTDSNGVAIAPAFKANCVLSSIPYQVTAAVTNGNYIPAYFNLQNKNGVAKNLIPTSSTSISTTVNTAFSSTFAARVEDECNNVLDDTAANYINGVQETYNVTFQAPASGASGNFAPGSTISTTISVNNGIATAPTFTATTVAGSYNVTATIDTTAVTTQYNATNLPALPANMSITGGDGQSAVISTTYGTRLSVRVTDQFTNPVPNVNVTFTAPSSGASGRFTDTNTTSTTAITDAGGNATAAPLTANFRAGSVVITATAATGSASTNFSLTNTAGPPATLIVITGGNNQLATVGTAFANPLQVRVEDAGGNPLNNRDVLFTAPSSGASGTFGITNSRVFTATSNTAGLATSSTFSANTLSGSNYTVSATVVGFPAVTTNFTLTNNPGAPATITITSGSPQSVIISSTFTPLSVNVVDSYSNPVANGTTITFTAPVLTGASGRFADTNTNITTGVTTAGGNFTSPTFTANHRAGSYTVVVTAGSVSANFNMTNLPGSPSTLVIITGSPQGATVNTSFLTNLQAEVRDSGANPLSGYDVTFSAPSSGASGIFASTGAISQTIQSNSSGRVTASQFTANLIAGTNYTVQAQVIGYPGASANFSLTNNPGAPNTLALTGSGQSAVIRTAFATNLGITVTDQYSNPVPGVNISWAAPVPGGGRATGTFSASGNNTDSATTNGSGVATASIFTAGGRSGTYPITVTVGSLTNNYTMTNLRGTPNSLVIIAGDGQTATISTAFATDLQVEVQDSGGNALPGFNVTFTAPSLGASGSFNATSAISQTVLSDSNGRATASQFIANTTSGSYTVRAQVVSTTIFTDFTLINQAGAPFSIEADAGVPLTQVITVSTNFGTNMRVLVKDASGNPVNNATINYSAPASGASGTFNVGNTNTRSLQTGTNGVADPGTFRANSTAGTYNVNVGVQGYPLLSLVFTMTNSPGAPASLTLDTGVPASQTITVTNQFPSNMIVVVRDASNNPIDGVTVNFSAPGSGTSGTFSTGGLNTRSVLTSGGGKADPGIFQANSIAGAYNVTATVSSLNLTFNMTNTAGIANSVTVNASTTPQSAVVSTTFGTNLTVTVRDQHNNPVSGVTVNYSAPTTGARGTFGGSSTTTATSNASGIADPGAFRAGTVAGSYSVTATVSGVATPATFSLTNTAGAASSVTANASTTPQNATVGTAFTNNLRVTVRDQYNNLVNGVTVNYSAPTTGARGTFGAGSTTSANTNTSGVADPGIFTAGTVAGSYTVTATVSGVATPVTFSLTNNPDVPASITRDVSTSPQSAVVSTTFGTNLTVVVRDQYSNALNGVQVNYSAPALTGASGTFVTTLPLTNTISVNTGSNGRADPGGFRANTIAGGPYNVTATVNGTSISTTFALTNTPGTAANVTNDTGVPASQSTARNTAFATNLRVVVTDAYGNIVPNASVTWTAPTTGARGTFSSGATRTVTATAGIADPGTFTANNTAGTYSVTATSGTGSFTFTMTNT